MNSFNPGLEEEVIKNGDGYGKLLRQLLQSVSISFYEAIRLPLYRVREAAMAMIAARRKLKETMEMSKSMRIDSFGMMRAWLW